MTREFVAVFCAVPSGLELVRGVDAFPAFPCRALVVPSLRDSDFTFGRPDPGLTSWAIFSRPSGLGSVDAHDFYELPAAWVGWVRRWAIGAREGSRNPELCCHDLHCSER